MRISEAYEHEPILPYQAEADSPMSGCGRVSTQCVDISASMTLVPTAAMGAVNIACQGTPEITCQTNAGGTSCTVVMTQQICVSVPVTYGVTMSTGEPTIACADNKCIGCGVC